MCWEPFESPWIRHGFLAPDCSYVERIKVEKYVIQQKRITNNYLIGQRLDRKSTPG